MYKKLFCLMLIPFVLSGCSSKNSGNENEEPKESEEQEEPPFETDDFVSTFNHFSEYEKHYATTNVVNGNFETGNLEGWYKETEDAPFEICSDEQDIWNNSLRKEGQYFLGFGNNNYSSENEQKVGRIRSSLFKIDESNLIKFRIAGSSQAALKGCVMTYKESGEHDVLYEFNNCIFGTINLSGFVMVPYTISISYKEHKDDLLYILLDDNATSSFAFFNIDNIEVINDKNAYVYANDLASYKTLPDIKQAITNHKIVSIFVKDGYEKYFKYGDAFSNNKLLVHALYDNGVAALLSKDQYLVNFSAYKKNVPGTYRIEIVVKNEAIATSYEVTVLNEGENLPGSKTITDASKLLLIGDSQFDFWDTAKDDIGLFHYVTNIAVGGTEAPYWIERLNLIQQANPDYIMLNIGGNDLRALTTTPDSIKENVKTLLNGIKEKCPNAHVFLFSPSIGQPTFYTNFKNYIYLLDCYRALEKEIDNVTFINIYGNFIKDDGIVNLDLYKEDNLHYNSSAYKIVAAEFKKYINV